MIPPRSQGNVMESTLGLQPKYSVSVLALVCASYGICCVWADY